MQDDTILFTQIISQKADYVQNIFSDEWKQYFTSK
jgi:hypothetical protein